MEAEIREVKAEIDACTLLARNKETMQCTLLQELLGGTAQNQTDKLAGIDPDKAFKLRERAILLEGVALVRVNKQLMGLREQITILEQTRQMLLSK